MIPPPIKCEPYREIGREDSEAYVANIPLSCWAAKSDGSIVPPSSVGKNSGTAETGDGCVVRCGLGRGAGGSIWIRTRFTRRGRTTVISSSSTSSLVGGAACTLRDDFLCRFGTKATTF